MSVQSPALYWMDRYIATILFSTLINTYSLVQGGFEQQVHSNNEQHENVLVQATDLNN